MSTLIKPPPPSVPLVDARGVVSLPWDLFFKALVDRVGGVEAPTIKELTVRSSPLFLEDGGGEDVMFIPGPPGPAGPAVRTVVMLFDESVVDDVVFIPR